MRFMLAALLVLAATGCANQATPEGYTVDNPPSDLTVSQLCKRSCYNRARNDYLSCSSVFPQGDQATCRQLWDIAKSECESHC
jgi:hypothetical protein